MTCSSDKEWYYKSLFYICNAVGHEGPNSLLSELINQGLATTLMTGEQGRLRDHFHEFTVTIGLTAKGTENIDKILELLFQFIHELKSEKHIKNLYEELQQMARALYHTSSQGSAMMASRQKTHELLKLKSSDVPYILCKDHIYFEIQVDEILKFLDFMVPEQAYYVMVSKQNANLPDLQKEKWYQTQFTKKKLSDQQLHQYKQPKLA